MPVENYEHPFNVVGEPYDYGLPGSQYVSFGTDGHEPEAEPSKETTKAYLHGTHE
jgi:hypothetical protein